MFDHVYGEPPSTVLRQRAAVIDDA
jgi:hypothetical protein